MLSIMMEEVDRKLKMLSENKLAAVYCFVSYLAEENLDMSDISARELMFGNESQIAKDWDSPEEDEAWAEELSEEIKSAWWNKNKSRIKKMISENK